MSHALPSPGSPTAAPAAPSAGNGVGQDTTWVIDPACVPNLDDIITKDDTPVDSIFAEKQQRLLTEPLYSSWPGPGEGKPFLALANVGLFHTYKQPPLVPDALLGLDVAVGADLRIKENHSYFVWLLVLLR